ncbi:hypothetical protein [Ruminococcus sp.]|uniref:hypothetical protein n=1 Tax=Ruminococcus sp. TaxID=41978 RepID=UPI002E81960A|nr:hypothetical protein [Ruminococcus sp.]MEE3439995.1 hypothetical protein [Ruminococcus sp.]
MKRTITLILLIVMIISVMCGCSKITDKVDFDKIDKLSIVTDKGKEYTLNSNQKDTVISALKNAESSSDSNDYDGGFSINGYIDSKVEYTFTIANENHITVNTNKNSVYKISAENYSALSKVVEEVVK